MKTGPFLFCLLFVLIAGAQTYPDQGAAQINTPFQRKVTGAVCFTGRGKIAGSAFFNFPTQDRKVLSFTIGPAAQGQEKNDTFTGPGTYSNIGIYLKPERGESIFGFGKVTVNDDERSGSFSFRPASSDDEEDDDEEGPAAGIWDCGRKLTH